MSLDQLDRLLQLIAVHADQGLGQVVDLADCQTLKHIPFFAHVVELCAQAGRVRDAVAKVALQGGSQRRIARESQGPSKPDHGGLADAQPPGDLISGEKGGLFLMGAQKAGDLSLALGQLVCLFAKQLPKITGG